jgi:hypothetical protein
MLVRVQDLPGDVSARLERIIQDKGLGEGAVFLPLRRVWLLWVGLCALAAGAVAAWGLVSGAAGTGLWRLRLPAWAGLTGLVYGTVALVDYLRGLAAKWKPFILVTPLNLIRCLGSHHPLEMYRLPEASQFNQEEEYEGATWQGQTFHFMFEGGHKVRFMLHSRKDIAAVTHTLQSARKAARGERLPDGPLRDAGDLCPGHLQALQGNGRIGEFLDPSSKSWLVVLALLVMGMLLWAHMNQLLRAMRM